MAQPEVKQQAKIIFTSPDGKGFSEAPRYRLLEKAFFSAVKVKSGRDFVPYADVTLDPNEQPIANKLSGPFDNKGGEERLPIEIEYEGIPDDHLDPLNDAAEHMYLNVDELKAKAMAEAAKNRRTLRRRDPIEAMTVIGPHAQVVTPG